MTSVVQTKLSSFDLNHASDQFLVSTYVEAWEFVCKENDKHSQYVEGHHLQQWYKYRDDTTKKLRTTITEFYLTTRLTDEQRSWLITESKRIINAKVKSGTVLKNEHEERERLVREAQRGDANKPREVPADLHERQALLEEEEGQHGWLSRLAGKVFGSK